MRPQTIAAAIALPLFLASCSSAPAVVPDPDVPTVRPPAVPLIACDPYFSIWSMDDTANGGPTRHWTGREHRLTSLVRIDGRSYRVLGDAPADLPAMPQTGLEVFPTRTVYHFEADGVALELSFLTPALPADLDALALPVGYVTWSARSIDGAQHDVRAYLDVAAELAVDEPNQRVRFPQPKTVAGMQVLSVGSRDQPVLRRSGDDRRIDWGYAYLAVPGDASTGVADGPQARAHFANGAAGAATAWPDYDGPAADAPVLSACLPLGTVGADATSRHVLLAYDDEWSARYFNEELRPYWRRDGADADDLLTLAEAKRVEFERRCRAFDAELVADLRARGGDSLVTLGVLAWRQALAAQKLCADADGQPLSFSKENNSNGCMATVDVLYPAAPQMLVFAPSLLKASLVPLMHYSASPRWTHDSAPHDLGTYPHATGQVYGGEHSSAMPVEESGNMLILFGALARTEGDAEFAAQFWPTLTVWKDYLVREGLDPENQLCTDDFAGHIARNANLSIKAIMGIASYGLLAELLGEHELAADTMATARDYAQKWIELAATGDHYQLVFGAEGEGTWSQKYNLVWDQLLELDVFPAAVADREVAFYGTVQNRYGLPLDSRTAYTKLDWELWTATLADDRADFQRIVDACAAWVDATPQRVPMSDWYWTDSGKQRGFKARSVVGGLFLPLMSDREVWHKYAARDRHELGPWTEYDFMPPPREVVVPSAETEKATWSYTTTKPADGWQRPDFDDAAWQRGEAGFGTEGTPNAHVGTTWNTGDIWLRRTFSMPDGERHDLRLYLHHDEHVEVYLNGVLAYAARGYVTRYGTEKMRPEALATLKPGDNHFAVHCHQTGGGQYVDVGIVDLLPREAR